MTNTNPCGDGGNSVAAQPATVSKSEAGDQPLTISSDMPDAPRQASASANGIARLRMLIPYLNPYCEISARDHVLRSLHGATDGGADGLAMADAWYRKRPDYPGPDVVAHTWRAFLRDEHADAGFAELCALVDSYGFDALAICSAVEPDFEQQQYELVDPAATKTTVLSAYSLSGSLEALRKEMVEQKRLLDGIALMGQVTVLYAAPNTGKTLLVLSMLIEAIKEGRVDPANVFYMNCDDGTNGLVQKVELAERYGFHMLAEGHKDFETRLFLQILSKVIASEQAKGLVIVLDTLKKFTDLMDKRSSAGFMTTIRKFVMKGGTAILLAHTNKKPGPDGKPVFAGTSDSRDDADCTYRMWVSSEAGAPERIVRFLNDKKRGDVRQQTTFAYSALDGLPYERLLASVRQVDDAETIEVEEAAQHRSDAELTSTVRSCIRDGIVKRMELIAAIAQRSKCGRRKAEELLDKYTGIDPQRLHWTYDVQARGAKVYRLLVSDPPADEAGNAASTSTLREPGHE